MTTDTLSTEKKSTRNWENAALVIVDVQNDFCPGGALAVADGDKVVPIINEIIEEAQRNGAVIVASQDAHPEETAHFKKWPKHCIVGTIGYDFHKDLNIRVLDIETDVFEKGTGTLDDGYSAFDGYNAKNQLLLKYLQGKGVTRLFVVGLATDYCVHATALDGVVNGFDTTVILPATRAVNINPNDEADAVCEMWNLGVEFEP